MKILAIDVGNSEIKRAYIDGGTIGAVQRNATNEFDNLVEEIVSQDQPVVLSSVRANVTSKLKTALSENKKTLALEINSRINEPVSAIYESMGADRVADISAAWLDYKGQKAVAVVGLGTATTITAASAKGKFEGGFITLGLGSVCSTLSGVLPELPSIDPNLAVNLEPAFDTYSSICKGTVSAHVGIVEEWISLFRRKLGEDMAVIATGGWSEFLFPFCYSIDRVDPLLTLRGIWSIYEHSINATSSSVHKSD
jgi:type III pantothenate kinase